MLTSRFPYPLEKGDKLRAYHHIRTLAEIHDIYLISLAEFNVSKAEMEAIRPLVRELHVIKINPMERFIALIMAIFSNTPFQNAFFYNKKAASYIRNTVDSIAPDHIYCQLARMAPYVSDLKYPCTLDYMDAFGVGMMRRSGVVNPLLGFFYRVEAKRMIRYEKAIFNAFDHHIIISEQDRKQLGLEKENSVHIIPNGIEDRFFMPSEVSPEYDIAFVGNMGYLPNIEAAEFLIQKVLPKLDKNTRVIIAGARPHARVRKLASNQVTVTGWLRNITDAYHSARMFVAPLWSGTGQQNKILEAMACGLPCITTSPVNNAIGAIPGQQILIADDVQKMADSVMLLKNDSKLAVAISEEGKRFVKQKYSWEHYSRVLSDIFTGNYNKHKNAD